MLYNLLIKASEFLYAVLIVWLEGKVDLPNISPAHTWVNCCSLLSALVVRSLYVSLVTHITWVEQMLLLQLEINVLECV
jgi:hypothetical protein